MNWFTVYLCLKLDDFQTFFIIATIILGGALLSYALIYICWLENSYGGIKKEKQKERDEFYSKYFFKKLHITMFLIFLFIAIFIPSTKQFAVLYLLPKIANDEQIQQIPNKTLTILNKKLDKWISDLQNENKKK